MASTAELTDRQRSFNWGFSVATACTLALHALAFLLVLAPVMAPHAAERTKDQAVPIHIVDPQPEPPKPPPPAPEPPQKPHPQVVHRALQPPPVQLPPPTPVIVSEASPVAEVAPPPRPPTPQASTNVRPSAKVTYRSKYRPQYPAQAIRQRQEGTVQLKILVGVDGNPLKIQIMGSSGYRSLDKAAIAAARQWKFNPARQKGVPRQGWVIIPIEFSLNRF